MIEYTGSCNWCKHNLPEIAGCKKSEWKDGWLLMPKGLCYESVNRDMPINQVSTDWVDNGKI